MTGRFAFPRRPATPPPDLRPVDPRAGDPDGSVPASHRHWHALGRPMEMIEFNRLQAGLAATLPVPEAEGERLVECAFRCGHADVEAFRSLHPDEAERADFQADAAGLEYLRAIDLSERILARIDGVESRTAAAAEICARMRSAYGRGCERARAADAGERSPSGPRP